MFFMSIALFGVISIAGVFFLVQICFFITQLGQTVLLKLIYFLMHILIIKLFNILFS